MSRHFSFEVEGRSGAARAGVFRTPHGPVQTPAFMPVGTQATVKAMTPEELRAVGAEMILSNAYHLYLRPGHRVVERLGGLHRMMNWDGAILTDSGGFQVHSLSTLRKITDRGVEFRSHIDGSKHLMTPALSMEIQQALGADVAMCFDDCASYPATEERVREAVERTLAWAGECRGAHTREDQALFGIVQGGEYTGLRKYCAQRLLEHDFPGYAIGGLSVGEPREVMLAALEETVPLLPEDRPRYLMGVGTPEDFFDGVSRGIDLFDCVMPTRTARNAMIFTSRGKLQVRRAELREEAGPPDPGCLCYTCRNYSAGYLRHLFVAKEILAARLATIHNLHFFLDLMRRIRESVLTGSFETFRSEFMSRYGSGTEE